MGMFDEKKYLTGDKGFAREGDEFYLHNAAVSGEVRNPSGPGTKTEVKLMVSHDGRETTVVYATNAAIVGQVQRMDDSDREAMPVQVRLDTLPAQGSRSPAFILTPAGEAPPEQGSTEEVPF